jgi:hypothetical protein
LDGLIVQQQQGIHPPMCRAGRLAAHDHKHLRPVGRRENQSAHDQQRI